MLARKTAAILFFERRQVRQCGKSGTEFSFKGEVEETTKSILRSSLARPEENFDKVHLAEDRQDALVLQLSART